MKRLQFVGIVMSITSLLLLGGCSLVDAFTPKKPVYMPAGSVVEVAAPVTAVVWVTNVETGIRERRSLDVPVGFWIARPALAPVGKTNAECPVPGNKDEHEPSCPLPELK